MNATASYGGTDFNRPLREQLLAAGWSREDAIQLARWYFTEYWWDVS